MSYFAIAKIEAEKANDSEQTKSGTVMKPGPTFEVTTSCWAAVFQTLAPEAAAREHGGEF